jgi:hypothetical protein
VSLGVYQLRAIIIIAIFFLVFFATAFIRALASPTVYVYKFSLKQASGQLGGDQVSTTRDTSVPNEFRTCDSAFE